MKNVLIDNIIDNNQSNPNPKKKTLNTFGNKLAPKQTKVTSSHILAKLIIDIVEKIQIGWEEKQ